MKNQAQIQVTENNITDFEKNQELNYWSKEFGISMDELLKAVQTGGTTAGAVEKYVKRLGHTH